MNLIGQETQSNKANKPKWIAGLAAVGLVFATWTGMHRAYRVLTERHSIGMEEAQLVVAALDRIEPTSPTSVITLDRFRNQLLTKSVPIVVERADKAQDLVRVQPDMVVFSNLFFEADPKTQERSLLKLIDPSALNKNPSDIAVIGD